MQSLQILNDHVVLMTMFAAVVYLFILFRAEHQNIRWRKVFYFFLGLVLINICFGDRLSFYGHLLFSVHMLQMSLLFFFIPPLILLGLPKLERSRFGRVAEKVYKSHFFHNVILVLFALLFSLYHLPAVFDVVMSHKAFHDFSRALLLVISLLVWCPVSSECHSKTHQGVKRRYIFKMLVLLMPACLFLILANKELYKIYSDSTFLSETLQICFSPNINGREYFLKYNFLSTIGEQKLGGVIMLTSHKLVSFLLVRAR